MKEMEFSRLEIRKAERNELIVLITVLNDCLKVLTVTLKFNGCAT